MADEIERKFLVTVLPDSVELGPGEELRQGYLAIDGAVEVRIRISGGAARLTIKAGSGLSRTEVEVPLAPTDADDLWEHTAGRRIEKVRHRVALAPGIDADVDRYRAGLSGLCTAEVEFADLESARAFPPPRWFGQEVTGEPGWSNAALARHGIPAAGGDQQD